MAHKESCTNCNGCTCCKSPRFWAVLRILIGLVFMWAFLDKMVGLGFATCRTVDPTTKTETVQVLCDKSVVKGGSPTEGFLRYGTSGPLKSFYSEMAGHPVADVLFMAGLGLIGTSLVTGIGIKVATATGSILLMMMWSAALPGENNPLIDDHVIYTVALIGIHTTNKHQVWGFGKWWQRQNIVVKYPFLA